MTDVNRQMPRYRSHKMVWALKIAEVVGHRIHPADDGFAPIDCPAEMFTRYQPVPGDYLVQYEGDGYRSFSPGKAFEDGYTSLGDTTAELAKEPIGQFFGFAHLQPAMQAVSRPFGEMAANIIATVPRNAERTVALRKLLEAKDAAVRAFIAKP